VRSSSFPLGSERTFLAKSLLSAFISYFRQIADQYSCERQRALLQNGASQTDQSAIESPRNKKILLIGHTDDTGNSRLNAKFA
jgi:hypothetical protein